MIVLCGDKMFSFCDLKKCIKCKKEFNSMKMYNNDFCKKCAEEIKEIFREAWEIIKEGGDDENNV